MSFPRFFCLDLYERKWILSLVYSPVSGLGLVEHNMPSKVGCRRELQTQHGQP
jgi:hypothetical protein